MTPRRMQELGLGVEALQIPNETRNKTSGRNTRSGNLNNATGGQNIMGETNETKHTRTPGPNPHGTGETDAVGKHIDSGLHEIQGQLAGVQSQLHSLHEQLNRSNGWKRRSTDIFIGAGVTVAAAGVVYGVTRLVMGGGSEDMAALPVKK